MNNNYTLKNTIIGTLTFCLMLSATALYSAQRVISADGREVQLNDDGTWKYLSNDRLANTSDGKQVLLKEDGSWQYAGNAPLSTDSQVRTTNIDLKLDKVVIETHEKKVQKNTRVRTQTVFYVDIQVSLQSTNNINIDSQVIDKIEVNDDAGKQYSILAISPQIEIKPGAKQRIAVRVEKSPSIFDDVKSMTITFRQGLFGLSETVSLTQKAIDFDAKKVDGFDYP